MAAVVSCFVLQQMARPRDVLATWTASLRPGGVLTVLFWPRAVEKEGPWRRLMDLTQAAAGGKPAEDWEAGLLQSAEEAGGVVVCDARISHSMEWESVDAFWEGMTRAGPWHSRRLQYGDEHMEELRAAFLQGYGPDGGRQPLQHAPEARLIVLRRQRGAAL